MGLETRPQPSVTAKSGRAIPLIDEYEWIISIDCITADGWAASSDNLVQDLYDDSDSDGDLERLLMKPVGVRYIDPPTCQLAKDLALRWLNYLHSRAEGHVAEGEGQSHLLLFRGQPAFLTLVFLRFCGKH